MGCKQQIAFWLVRKSPRQLFFSTERKKHSKSAHLPIDAYPKTAAHIVTCVGHRRLIESCWGLSILAGGLFLQILLVLSDFLIYFIALMTDVWIMERLPSLGNAEQLMILRCVRL